MNNLRSHFLTKWNIYRLLKAALLASVLTLVIYNGWKVRANKTVDKIIVYASSSHEEVISQGIIPAFKQVWKASTGEDIEIEATFGPSATRAGQIVLSAPADVVLFSNPYHVKWLKLWRIVNEETQPIIFGYSPIVIVSRPNNAIQITSFSDLSSPELQLVHGDPRTSGVGEWSVLAEYCSAMLETQDPDIAASQLQNIWHNVKWLGSSARSASKLFELGSGDALITYEQEALQVLDKGVPLEIVIPTRTIITQHAAVIVDKNVSHLEKPVCQAFIDFLVSPAGQKIFSDYYLRPVNLPDGYFPPLVQPFTVEDFGGWKSAYNNVIETIWEVEIEPLLTPETVTLHSDSGE